MNKNFSERDVQLIISNPIYVGIGPYQQIIADDLWVDNALRAIQERGANFWRDVQTNVIESLDLPEEKVLDICMNVQKLYDVAPNDEAHTDVLNQLLFLLREASKP